ncbi:hypothetical protein [Thetidibacter halocola]|uniref:Uncharacterized protein n=1 Tax=Thetidibacter halocola TaxID=2827239 RepID=A0A8J7WEK2_9RHOB|nr:hypothetical protein [Thetidibacter halocola]MBS0123941.1 hypothetical protein [Thetidibacter halocola]
MRKAPMKSLPTINFEISQLYPCTGVHRINTCANPDCFNFGKPFADQITRQRLRNEKYPDLSPEQAKLFDKHGPGTYKLSGADNA